jgi:hypothetical protein
MTEISRKLTVGERGYAMQIFGTSIQYDKVLIHNTKAYFFQPGDTAMAPNGEIYFPIQVYKPDFSFSIPDAAWLIHELTHVWQHQIGTWVKIRGAFNRNYHYNDLKSTNQSFSSYSIEQQAAIVTDYFLLKHGFAPYNGKGSMSDYEKLIPFLPRRGK